MTELTIANEFTALSATPEVPADVEVLEGEVEYSSQKVGPFRAEGTLAQGRQARFETSIVLLAESAKVKVTYPESEEHLRERNAQWTPPSAADEGRPADGQSEASPPPEEHTE